MAALRWSDQLWARGWMFSGNRPLARAIVGVTREAARSQLTPLILRFSGSHGRRSCSLLLSLERLLSCLKSITYRFVLQ